MNNTCRVLRLTTTMRWGMIQTTSKDAGVYFDELGTFFSIFNYLTHFCIYASRKESRTEKKRQLVASKISQWSPGQFIKVTRVMKLREVLMLWEVEIEGLNIYNGGHSAKFHHCILPQFLAAHSIHTKNRRYVYKNYRGCTCAMSIVNFRLYFSNPELKADYYA